TILRHLLWRTGNFFRWQLNPGGDVFTFFWRTAHPKEWRLPLLRRAALGARRVAQLGEALPPTRRNDPPRAPRRDGITAVIPSRAGRELLERALPAVERELAGIPSEIVIVDNGSSDGTASAFPQAVMEVSAEPLSFARAVNRGIRRARFSH